MCFVAILMNTVQDNAHFIVCFCFFSLDFQRTWCRLGVALQKYLSCLGLDTLQSQYCTGLGWCGLDNTTKQNGGEAQIGKNNSALVAEEQLGQQNEGNDELCVGEHVDKVYFLLGPGMLPSFCLILGLGCT